MDNYYFTSAFSLLIDNIDNINSTEFVDLPSAQLESSEEMKATETTDSVPRPQRQAMQLINNSNMATAEPNTRTPRGGSRGGY